MTQRLRADFNGLFGGSNGETFLCLSHGETAKDENGAEVRLVDGMQVTVYDEDLDINGKRDDLIANGTVIVSPDWMQCLGSKWALLVNKQGVYNESERIEN